MSALFLCLALLAGQLRPVLPQQQQQSSSYERRCQLSPPNYPRLAICTFADLQIIPNDLPPTLEKLDLSNNRIHSADNTLRHYPRLTHLTLARNSVREIQPGSFQSSPGLAFLSLESNRLATLSPGDLQGLGALKELNLGDNLLESLPSGLLSGLTGLEWLDLSGNRLRRLPGGLLRPTPGIQTLILAGNEFERVPSEALQYATHLSDLVLDDNPGLGSAPGDLDRDSLRALTRLRSLSLRGCELRSLPQGFLEAPGRSLRTLDLSSNRLSRLGSLALRPASTLKELRVGLNDLEDLDFLPSLPDLETLVLAGCLRSCQDLRIDAGTFAENLELRTLNVTNCACLTSVPAGSLDSLPFLRTLNLAECGLETLSESAADFSALEHLDLTGNPLRCDCEMEWLDRFLHDRTEMPRPTCQKPRDMRDEILGEGNPFRDAEEDCDGDGDGGGDGGDGDGPALGAGAIVGIILSAALVGAALLACLAGDCADWCARNNASDDEKWWRMERRNSSRVSSFSSTSGLLKKRKKRKSVDKSDIVVLPASVKDSSRYVDVIRSREGGLEELADAKLEEAAPLETPTPMHIYEELPYGTKESVYGGRKKDGGSVYGGRRKDKDGGSAYGRQESVYGKRKEAEQGEEKRPQQQPQQQPQPQPRQSRQQQQNFPDIKVSVL